MKTLKKKIQLLGYRKKIDKGIEEYFSSHTVSGTLTEACYYAISGEAKRLRPILVMLIADELSLGVDVMPAALAVEFFHTASLIADDLPCMDNEENRRGKKAIHLVYGEDIALLSSYTFIAMGYEMLTKAAKKMRETITDPSQCDFAAIEAVETSSRCGGLSGATHGQFLDLRLKETSFDELMQIVHEKTEVLFEVSFVLGWLFGGGDREKLKTVRECSHHFGRAFQLIDDLLDEEEDKKFDHKNITKLIEKQQVITLINKEIDAFEKTLQELQLFSSVFLEIIQMLRKKIHSTSIF